MRQSDRHANVLFQSTLPRGERRSSHRQAIRLHRLVSIHAPARGATPDGRTADARLTSFNPRSRAGSDSHAPASHATASRCFNPRSRAGSDGRCMPTGRMTMSFNPRSRAGSDSKCRRHRCNVGMFQSTLPRGERQCRHGCQPRLLDMFQSTLPRGERLHHAIAGRHASAMFQSTLPRGERHRSAVSTSRCCMVSIHAPARGATSVLVTLQRRCSCVSIHAPARGATISRRDAGVA